MKISKIIWRDIQANNQWQDLKEAEAWGKKQYNAQHTTVGYVIYENKDFILIAGTYSKDEPPQYNDVSLIPKSVIIKR